MKLLNDLQKKLLDLNKTNNLINFKSNKQSLELLYPQIDNIISALEEGKSPIYLSYSANLLEGSNLLTKEEYLNKFKKLLKNNELLFYINDEKAESLRNINHKALEWIDEKGINVLYLALGFIVWNDDGVDYKAPVLLIPVKINFDATTHKASLSLADDEYIVNPTFRFKLEIENKIYLPDYKDDELVSSYLEKVKILVKPLNYAVINEMELANFSFLKINMYLDIKENAKTIENSQTIKYLLGLENVPTYLNNKKSEKIHCVNLADESQREAIIMAKSGQSFVLQGPPGTGKSQTITNIIAEAIYDNKSVLFVSEKQAALNVVYNKLANVGLDKFCLPLHSYKANKKDVIEDLYSTLLSDKVKLSNGADEIINKLLDDENLLDAYYHDLHDVNKTINMSCFDIVNRLITLSNYCDVFYNIKKLNTRGENYLNRAINLLKKYQMETEVIGLNYHEHPLYGIITSDNSYLGKKHFLDILNSVINYSSLLYKEQLLFNEKLHLSLLSSNETIALADLINILGTNDILNSPFFDINYVDEIITEAEIQGSIALQIKKYEGDLKKYCKEPFNTFDGAAASKYLDNITFYKKFGRKYKLIKKSYLDNKITKKFKYEDLKTAYNLLANLQKEKKEFDKYIKLKNLNLKVFNSYETNFNYIMEILNEIKTILKYNKKFGMISNISFDNTLIKDIFKASKRCLLINKDYKTYKEELYAYFDKKVLDFENNCIEKLIDKLNNINENISHLEDWISFWKLYLQLKQEDLSEYIDLSIKKQYDIDEYIPQFEKCFLSQWLDEILNKSKVLGNLSKTDHFSLINDYEENANKSIIVNQAIINASALDRFPNINFLSASAQASILLREHEKKRKQKSIRELFEAMPYLLMQIKPCFLMSPLSVSTFLNSEIMHFDMVIFDEASQVFLEDAIGSIYRANQLIVVGDNKQMPPTNFFNTSIDEYDDLMSEDAVAYESILDIAATRFPEMFLKWHYRSKAENLIAFSNQYYYNNRLISFPSCNDSSNDFGIERFYLPNAIYKRGSRQNRDEANKVVELICNHIKVYPGRSLGVVAFSIAQQELISRVLLEESKQNIDLANYINASTNEPFFIKNLETVQGDERDTIIFSIGYGYDENHHFINNFGPLNKDGGERRLNVAITRAKINLKIVTSILSSDIDVANTSSKGVQIFHDYLYYIENLKANITNNNDDEAILIKEIKDFLVLKGYHVLTNLGNSQLKLDVAVFDKEGNKGLLAIETDGISYKQLKQSIDRDFLRKHVFEKMGWSYIRIFSKDWYSNKQKEKNSLLAILNNIDKSKEEVSNAQKECFLEKINDITEIFDTYELSDFSEIICNNDTYLKAVKELLLREAPISEEFLLRRSLSYFGKERLTPAVYDEFELKMKTKTFGGMKFEDGFYYIKNCKCNPLRLSKENERPYKFISPYELANGMYKIIEQCVVTTKHDLFSCLGAFLDAQYTKTNNIGKQFEKAFMLLKDNIIEENNLIRINKNNPRTIIPRI